MRTILATILCLCAWLYASDSDSLPKSASPYKYLKISTSPMGADVFVNQVHPDFASSPDFITSGFAKVPAEEDSVRISLFSPEYADTTLNVKLSARDTSYIIISLRQTYDEKRTEKQQKILAHRFRRQLGHKLILSSMFPISIGGIAAIVANYNIGKADGKKKEIERSLIHDEKFEQSQENFHHYKDNARSAKKWMNAGLIAGGIILTTGIILSF